MEDLDRAIQQEREWLEASAEHKEPQGRIIDKKRQTAAQVNERRQGSKQKGVMNQQNHEKVKGFSKKNKTQIVTPPPEPARINVTGGAEAAAGKVSKMSMKSKAGIVAAVIASIAGACALNSKNKEKNVEKLDISA